MIIIGITAAHSSQFKSAADAPVVSTTNVNAYANTITWTQPASSGTILDYKIESSTDNINWTVLSTTNTTRTFSHNPLSQNTRYYYRVAARTSSGYGSYGVANQLTRVAALRTRLILSNYASNSTTGTTPIPLGVNSMEAVVVGSGGWAVGPGGGGGGVIYASSFPVPAGGTASYSIGYQLTYGGAGVSTSLTSVVSGITYQMVGGGGGVTPGNGVGGTSGSTSKSGSFVTQSWGSRPGGGASGFADGGGGGATSNGTSASGYTAGSGGDAVTVAGNSFGGGGGGASEAGEDGASGGGYGSGGTGFASGSESPGSGAVWLRWFD